MPARPAFLSAVLLFFLVTHLWRIADPPNGFHRWRETDTVAVARNFATESWNLLRPRIDPRGSTDGVVGMEFPVYSWSVAAASALGADLHVAGRLLTVLGACAALFGFHRIVRSVTGRADLAGIAVFLAAGAPLLVFYGRKMLPDVWGLAFATHGLARFLRWADGGSRLHGVAAAALIALAGAIKPTFLAAGLPMLVLLAKRRGRSFLREPRWWLFAAGCLVPVAVWFRYASGLNPDPGSSYYYLGGNWDEIGRALATGRFWANVFRTWMLELVIGTPVVWAFAVGLARLPALPNAGFFVAWMAGSLVVCFLTAQHCATAHDYYMLPAVFPFAVPTALGLQAALRSARRWARALAVAAAVATPVHGFARVADRWGVPYDLEAGRAEAARHVPPGEPVVTLERTPCFLLYYAGRKGWNVRPGQDARALEAARRGGARVLLVENEPRPDLAPYEHLVGPLLWADDRLTAYRLRPAEAPAPHP